MGDTKIIWFGHACFKIVSDKGKVILIDPWLENPLSPIGVSEIGDVDIILITHDHFDHVGNTKEIVENRRLTIIANVETAQRLASEGISKENILFDGYGMNIGGTAEVSGIKIVMVHAFHSTATGSPCGYVIELEDGKRIYHAGDTGIFYGMELIGKMYPLDVALLPIGSTFTMDPYQAGWATKLLSPKKVIPMHYKSFPIIEKDAKKFTEWVRKLSPETEIVVLEPGQEYRL